MTQDVHRKYSFTREAGFHERVNIDGYGPVRAKLDTGNGTVGTGSKISLTIASDSAVVNWGQSHTHRGSLVI